VPDFRGHVATFDLAKRSEISHVELDPDVYDSYRRRVPMLIPFLKLG
jgi:hypothetical protein